MRTSLHKRASAAGWAAAFGSAAVLIAAVFYIRERRAAVFERERVRAAVHPMVCEAAVRHGVPPLLIEAVIRQESGFRVNAVGRAGEVGLMQITLPVAQDWARATGRPCPDRGMLFDPRLNIEIGAWYLARAVRRWEETDHSYVLALAQYNAGPKRVAEWQRRSRGAAPLDTVRFSSTRGYIKSVLKWYAESLGKRNEREPETHRSGRAAEPSAGRESEGRVAGDGADTETRPAG